MNLIQVLPANSCQEGHRQREISATDVFAELCPDLGRLTPTEQQEAWDISQSFASQLGTGIMEDEQPGPKRPRYAQEQTDQNFATAPLVRSDDAIAAHRPNPQPAYHGTNQYDYYENPTHMSTYLENLWIPNQIFPGDRYGLASPKRPTSADPSSSNWANIQLLTPPDEHSSTVRTGTNSYLSQADSLTSPTEFLPIITRPDVTDPSLNVYSSTFGQMLMKSVDGIHIDSNCERSHQGSSKSLRPCVTIQTVVKMDGLSLSSDFNTSPNT
ncbi:hypothetical protein PtA15_1A165 [Puccinia triticina]|uniref:Uncharacterized protein n=1 Tax=Puccinia triticina TaxID=208348 RepID=A0ABY7C8Q1_9BASI|nr:uncharacterized protein PtA15_1A165 [Puccinia triticina]WAQ80827.1 hypothetical protein PtA15_1A165 [Puccinia triticina]WAR51717.1 hypothetical protein PtB15_1B153 [Puccinia triticina]